jgi:hypothetical protein
MEMNPEIPAGEDWAPSGHQKWSLHTADGFVGEAHWREKGAGILVSRPDGTELYKKTWGSRAIFLDSWPGMFEWLKAHVAGQIASERSKPPAPPSEAAEQPAAV